MNDIYQIKVVNSNISIVSSLSTLYFTYSSRVVGSVWTPPSGSSPICSWWGRRGQGALRGSSPFAKKRGKSTKVGLIYSSNHLHEFYEWFNTFVNWWSEHAFILYVQDVLTQFHTKNGYILSRLMFCLDSSVQCETTVCILGAQCATAEEHISI